MYSICVELSSAPAPSSLSSLSSLSSPAAPRPGARAGGPAPEDLHPALWRAWQLGQLGSHGGRGPGSSRGGVASGFDALDMQLPGGGWPGSALTELLLPQPGLGELRLLAPALAALQGRGRAVMWFDPPAEPCAWALGAMGLSVRQLVLVRPRPLPHATPRPRVPAADVLWALEQALKSGHLGAALAWLPARLPADALRRLQLAAQAHEGPVFLFRAETERTRPSPAPLRLLLRCAGPDALQVHLLKRRGPPLQQALLLELPQVLGVAVWGRAAVLQPSMQPGVQA